MASKSSSNFAAPIPIIRSFDEAKTKEFYIDFLGFTIEFEHRFHDGAPLYMGVRKGDCILHISEHFGDSVPGVGMRIQVPDVSAYMQELRDKSYRHANPGEPETMEWGTRDIVIQDPSGNRLCFYSVAEEQA